MSTLKRFLLPSHRRSYTIRWGALRGLRLELDPQHQSQILLGLYEQEIHGWLNRLVSSARTGVDVGAAEGAYTLYFLRRPGIESAISIEPSLPLTQILQRNLALNGQTDDPRLALKQCLVGEERAAGVETLDSLLDGAPLPCLIKVDVDGAELSVLKGASKILAINQAYWLIETHSVDLERQCIQLLTTFGAKTVVVRNAWWRFALPEMRPIPHNRWLVGMPSG